jgi:hypothetical protein
VRLGGGITGRDVRKNFEDGLELEFELSENRLCVKEE